MILLEIY